MKFLKPIILLFFILFVSLFALFFLKSPKLLEDISFSTAVVDEQQHLLRLTLSQDEKYRLFTPLTKIPRDLIAATLLQEDQYFRNHLGINPIALLHAAFQTYILQKRRFGASTITMQLARLRFQIHSKTILGKAIQIARALQLEMHYSKDQILEAYLNLAPYGGNVEGVGAASLIYFNKPIEKLTLPEALTLAVIPQNPSERAVVKDKLQSVRNKLFQRWLIENPKDKAQGALFSLPLVMENSKNLPFLAPHFVNALLTELKNRPLSKPALIHSTLDLRLQKTIERTTVRYINSKNHLGAYNAAVLLVDTRDLSVKAHLGSSDFFNQKISGQINGTDIPRSPGSTLKPFIYGLALDKGLIHPYTVLKDVPHYFGNYNPENFDNDFMGPIKARDALILSRNIPAIYLESQLGSQNLYQLLSTINTSHLKSESYYGLSLSLGGVEMTMKELISLYAMLQNEGFWKPIQTLKNAPKSQGIRLLSPEASFLVLDMLQQTTKPLNYRNTQENTDIAWKTGTSSGFRDAWTVGIFGPYALAVWIGNFDNKGNPAFVGKNIAAPLFFSLVETIQQEKGHIHSLAKNPNAMNLVKTEVCKASGLLPTRFCQEREQTWFIPGKSPITKDTIFREVAINSKTGLRACQFNQDTRFEIYEFWPSDLLAIFRRAGIQRRIPPLYESDCSLNTNLGLKPQINSLQKDVVYISATQGSKNLKIPLSAVVDMDVHMLYWFANNTFLGTSSPMLPFFWEGKPGKFVIRVVDDHGLSDAKDITIS